MGYFEVGFFCLRDNYRVYYINLVIGLILYTNKVCFNNSMRGKKKLFLLIQFAKLVYF